MQGCYDSFVRSHHFINRYQPKKRSGSAGTLLTRPIYEGLPHQQRLGVRNEREHYVTMQVGEEPAPFYPIGSQVFQSVEYPGRIGPSPASLDTVLRGLGRPEDWNHVFNKTRSNLELSLRPGDHWAHPIPGDRTNTHRVLLKVIRRRRKQTGGTESHDLADEGATRRDEGVYKIEVPGTVKQTVRYRGAPVDFRLAQCFVLT